ncbi:MAG: PAS domain S-box protein [Dehalococcoidia bacterium]|nr:PAS domain S-box protein [Dehalococcoidia bacterium]
MKKSVPDRIVGISVIGFIMAALLVAADEVLDVPAHVFGAPPTPINWTEIGIEVLCVAVVGILTVFFISRLNLERKQAHERILHLNTILRTIYNINQLIVRVKSRDELLQGACNKLVETRGYDGAWIVLLEANGKFLAGEEAGVGEGFSAMVDRLKSGEMMRCIKQAIEQPDVVVVVNPAVECDDCPLVGPCTNKARMMAHLKFESRLYGFLSVTLPDGMTADEEERDLFCEMVDDITLALRNSELDEGRKQAEEELRRSKAVLTEAQRIAHMGNWIWDIVKNELSWSDEIYRIFGLTQPACETTFEAFLNLAHPDDREFVQKSISEALHEQKNYSIDHRVVLPDGTVRAIHEQGEAVFDEAGRPIQMVGTVQDITEYKEAEEALQREKAYEGSIINSAPDMIFAVDTKRNISYINKAMAQFVGVEPQEVKGKPLAQVFEEFKLLTPGRAAIFAENIEKHLQTGEPIIGVEMEMRNGKGGIVPCVYSESGIIGPHGEAMGEVVIVKDISKRKEMEEKLIITDRLASVGELASGIAHEMNNPLTGVIGLSELLLEKDVPDGIREDLETVHSEAQRVAEVVKNLLTFARKHLLAKQSLDVNEVINKVLALRAYEQKVNNIQVDIQFGRDLPPVQADYFQLQQVFLNIVINAEYFMTEAHNGGTLMITTEKAGDFVRVSFADDGPGIAREDLTHLLDPFFTTKRAGKGTGLGLSICHGIITEHGGRIYAESELGKGATFVVELPQATE